MINIIQRILWFISLLLCSLFSFLAKQMRGPALWVLVKIQKVTWAHCRYYENHQRDEFYFENRSSWWKCTCIQIIYPDARSNLLDFRFCYCAECAREIQSSFFQRVQWIRKTLKIIGALYIVKNSACFFYDISNLLRVATYFPLIDLYYNEVYNVQRLRITLH